MTTPFSNPQLDALKREIQAHGMEDTRIGATMLNVISSYRLLAAAYAKTQVDEPKVQGYKDFVRIYNDFCHAQTGLPARINVASGKAMKSIIKDLTANKDAAASPDPTAYAQDFWAAILGNWDKLSPWLQAQTDLPAILKRLPEIILKLRAHGNASGSALPAKPAQQAAQSAAASALARKRARAQ